QTGRKGAVTLRRSGCEAPPLGGALGRRDSCGVRALQGGQRTPPTARFVPVAETAFALGLRHVVPCHAAPDTARRSGDAAVGYTTADIIGTCERTTGHHQSAQDQTKPYPLPRDLPSQDIRGLRRLRQRDIQWAPLGVARPSAPRSFLPALVLGTPSAPVGAPSCVKVRVRAATAQARGLRRTVGILAFRT